MARKGLNAVKVMARDRMPQRNLVLLFDMLVLSQVDYGFGLRHCPGRNLEGRDQERRPLLGCTKDTSAAAMRYVLGLPSMKEIHRLAHPLHDKIGRQTNSGSADH